MTTIAYDGKVLAADTAHWKSDTLGWNGDKIRTVTDRSGKIVVAYAVCGSYMFSLTIEQHILDLLDGRRVDPVTVSEDQYFYAFVIDMRDSEPILFEVGPDMILQPAGYPMAIGSGGEIALTAMRCGKNAIKAVELACETNAYTRGPVTALDCKKRKFVRTLEDAYEIEVDG